MSNLAQKIGLKNIFCAKPEDWSDPGLAEIRESLEELLDYTTYIDPERSGERTTG